MTALRALAGSWRTGLIAAVSLAILVEVGLGLAGALRNVHAVVPGELYRSAQPTAADLRTYAQRYGLRTVINLRGANPGKAWYEAERREAEALGLTMIDVTLSAKHVLPPDQAEALIAVMRRAAKPALVHCASGADRTGLAAALYLAAVARQGEAAAEEQMSWRYGHVVLPGSRRRAIDDSFEALEPRLGFGDS
jgi:protein tyrosine/serine phosphatase